MAGLLDSVTQTLGNLVSLPGNVVNAYAKGYAQLPQQYAAEAEMRRIALENARRVQGLLPGLSPSDQLALITNPAKLGEYYAQNDGPQKLAQGETAQYYGAGGPQVTAPLFDPTSGRTVQMGPNASLATSPTGAPGSTSATGGLVIDSRQGVTGTYSQPEQVPLTSRPSSFTPTVLPPGAAPPASSPGQPGTIPLPSQIPEMFPGASVTSGYRSPAKNAQVGGVPNSAHMQGTPDAPGALDIVPPPGGSMADVIARLIQMYPQARVLNEGDHAHMQGQPGSPGSPQGWAMGSATPEYGPRTWNPLTNQFEQTNNVTGKVEGAGTGAFNPQDLRKSVLDHADYKDATAAITAYKSMVGNADKMTGPSAYSMLDTFARTINPGAVARNSVIQTIEQHLGLPAQFTGSLESKFGQGNLPVAARQQILDAVVKFAQAHWDNANALNQANSSVATRTGIDPRNVVAPLDERPAPVHIQQPPKERLMKGEVYVTPKGAYKFTGTGFVPYAQ